ncbi:hypothetical protein AB3662_39410 [Sorangium cellulosum]|uniref:hypothetical protein n=1 Tax=Sorangium cellulosum TaxID=56 RepID=UPI003D9A300F
MDAFTEIGVFVRVVDARSFTRAGRMVGLTASGVSRVGAHEHREVPIHALYTRDKASLPKVRAFLDFIAECLSATPGGAKAAPSSAKAVAPGARSAPAAARAARRRGEPTPRAAR